uniref:Uncharacterized protein n=1 Tax=Anguilla anguilla TaxID=7936 RepID=A0A0E9SSG4_ANGAN
MLWLSFQNYFHRGS